MLTKVLELRDKATFIPVLAVEMIATDAVQSYYIHARAGYSRGSGSSSIMVTRLSGEGKASADPYFWGDRTWTVAHDYITKHWDTLRDGDVIDVEHILGETATAKVSERFDAGLG